jgi:hypothetical protein
MTSPKNTELTRRSLREMDAGYSMIAVYFDDEFVLLPFG